MAMFVILAAGGEVRAEPAPAAKPAGRPSQELGAPEWVLPFGGGAPPPGLLASAGAALGGGNPAAARLEAFTRALEPLAGQVAAKVRLLVMSGAPAKVPGAQASEEMSGAPDVTSAITETRVHPDLLDDWTSLAGSTWALAAASAAEIEAAVERQTKVRGARVAGAKPPRKGGGVEPARTIVSLGVADLATSGKAKGEAEASAALAAVAIALFQASAREHGVAVKSLSKSFLADSAEGRESNLSTVAKIMGEGAFGSGGAVRVRSLFKQMVSSNSRTAKDGAETSQDEASWDGVVSVEHPGGSVTVSGESMLDEAGIRTGGWRVQAPEGTTPSRALAALLGSLPGAGLELVDLSLQHPAAGAPVVRARLRVATKR